MGAASSSVYYDENESSDLPKKESSQVNTNVICVGFSILKDVQKEMALGDPIFCGKCLAVMNVYSKFSSTNPNQINDPSNDKQWICEFCGHQNVVSFEPEEFPTKDDIVYLLKSAAQTTKKSSDKEESKHEDDESSLILCLDNSGSMNSTVEIQASSSPIGKFEIDDGLTEEERQLLAQFIEPGADQFFYQKKNVTHVSRKQAVKIAVESLLLELAKIHPTTKVGMVTFDNEVSLIGDGEKNPVIITGDKLNNYLACLELGQTNYANLISRNLIDTHQKIVSKYNKLNPNGKTALGPALLSSIALASMGKPGSRVIICTDGLANVGLGDIENDLFKAKEFYEKIGEYAKLNNVSISVITIKGEGCNIEILGKLADMTNGTVTRVDIENIENQFQNLLKEEIIATGVELQMHLHKGLKFKNEDKNSLSYDQTKCFKKIGNVTAKTQTTCEYEIKSVKELKESDINLKNLSTIPLQAQITYYDHDGNKYVRIITKRQNLTKNREDIEKNANVQILATHAVQQNAKLALEGKIQEAESNAMIWNDYMVNNIGSKGDAVAKKQVQAFQKQNNELILAIQSKEDVDKNKLEDQDQADEAIYNLKKINMDDFNQRK